jgi:hypothetical protein
MTLDFEITSIVLKCYFGENEISHKSPLSLVDLVTSDRVTLRSSFVLQPALLVCRPVDSLGPDTFRLNINSAKGLEYLPLQEETEGFSKSLSVGRLLPRFQLHAQKSQM